MIKSLKIATLYFQEIKAIINNFKKLSVTEFKKVNQKILPKKFHQLKKLYILYVK